MRRNEKQITDREAIDALIRGSRTCRLGMSDGNRPYVIPLCFGYDGDALYFHCAPEGRKIEILRRNPEVCVEFDSAGAVVEAKLACAWGIGYRSVIAFGRALRIDDPAEKKKGLRLLMAQYSPPGQVFTFPAASVARTTVFKIVIAEITGKQSIRQQAPVDLPSQLRKANAALFERGETESLGAYFSPDYIAHVTGRDIAGGHKAIRRIVALYQKAFAEIGTTLEILAQQGDRVAWQRTIHAIHRGPFKGFPATNRRLVWREMVTSRFEGGLIVEEWFITDLAEQLLVARKAARP